MGCAGCSTSTDGKPGGCGSNGNCGSGGCNRLNTYDWLTTMDIKDVDGYDIVEVSFKNGARKAFFKNPPHIGAITGDRVVVDTGSGWDVGSITLSGELVKLQIKKKRVKVNGINEEVLRLANERDIEKMDEARKQEMPAIIKAREIARTIGLDMKIGDIEFQADKRKATFFYTADGRVDFRELIRYFAKEFKVKIEMRQIGARQETARLGGIGSCGRELCCSTWLTDFKSVNTSAARYQNLAINQAKLSGMCGRLKCCLNFELDSYLEALEDFPRHADKLKTQAHDAVLLKTDIFKRIMYYATIKDGRRGKVYTLPVDRVKEIIALNKAGKKPEGLVDHATLMLEAQQEEEKIDFESVNNVLELPMEKRNKKRRNSRNKRRKPGEGKGNDKSRGRTGAKKGGPKGEAKEGESKAKSNRGPRKPRPPRGPRKDGEAKGPKPNGENKGPKKEGGNNKGPKRNGPKAEQKDGGNKGGGNRRGRGPRKPRPPRGPKKDGGAPKGGGDKKE